MVKNRSKRKAWPLARWRIWVQAGFLLAWLDPFLLRMHGICSPVFHCYSCPWATFACPIGILAQYGALHVIPFLAVGTLLIVGSLFGSLVCGWACPFGFLQDLVARIPTPKLRLPGWLGLTRYAVLVGLVFLVPYYYGEESPWFICRVCPAGALEAAVPYSVQQSIAQHAIVWPTREQIGHLGGVLAFDALRPAPLVYALLPAGRDLRSVQLRVGGVLAVPTEPLQRLRSMPRPVQIPWTIGTAGERPPLHSLFRVRAVPGPLHRDGVPSGERHSDRSGDCRSSSRRVQQSTARPLFGSNRKSRSRGLRSCVSTRSPQLVGRRAVRVMLKSRPKRMIAMPPQNRRIKVMRRTRRSLIGAIAAAGVLLPPPLRPWPRPARSR